MFIEGLKAKTKTITNLADRPDLLWFFSWALISRVLLFIDGVLIFGLDQNFLSLQRFHERNLQDLIK